LILSACGNAVQHNQSGGNQKMKVYSHTSGVVLSVPENIEVIEEATGFLVTPPALRDLSVLSIKIIPNAQAPDGTWTEERKIGRRTIKYRVDKDAGGSGGDGYNLTAWETHSYGYVIYEAGVTAEWPMNPNFDFYWQVIDNITFKL
jgi:hypothetical protein